MSGSIPTDSELLEHWGAGCTRAGNELIERYFPVVYRFFRNKAGTEIEDLVQQTFLACIEARARYRDDSNFRTFLLASARNQLLKRYGKRQPAFDVATASVRDFGTTPTGAIARHEDERLLLDALQRIALEHQIVLELVYWEGLDVVEIARVLEVPLNTAYSRLRRARLALRARMQRLCPERGEAARS